uniref:Glycine-rich 5 n=1 Tax=Tetranychus evansi TaxID=178897 RepID=A0A3G5APF3_9ACAR|nr:glycine-rich 5 [Tetranychus evansi]
MKFALALCVFFLISLSSATILRRQRQAYDSGLVSGIGIGRVIRGRLGDGCRTSGNRGSIGIGIGIGGQSGGNKRTGGSGSGSGSRSQGGAGLGIGGQYNGNRGSQSGISGQQGADTRSGSNSGSGSQGSNAGASIGLSGGQGGSVAVGARSGSEVTNSGNVNGYQNNLDRSRTSANGFSDNAQASRGYENSGSSFLNEANLARTNRQFSPVGGFSDSSLSSSDRSAGSNFRNTGYDNSASQKAGFNFDADQIKASQAGFNAGYFNQARNNAEAFGVRM